MYIYIYRYMHICIYIYIIIIKSMQSYRSRRLINSTPMAVACGTSPRFLMSEFVVFDQSNSGP